MTQHNSNEKVYLKVPFVQKEFAKQLGARFDFQKKSWYVDRNQDLRPFSAWLYPEQQALVHSTSDKRFEDVSHNIESSGESLLSINEESKAAGELQLPPSVPLLNLLQMVGQAIQKNFMQAIWVSAEIAQIKQYKQHRYLELVQRGENESEELAKVRATIWSSRQAIIKQFEQQTGKTLVADLKVLLQVNCTFHERYGLSLDILQINAEYMLGQMQRKINAIRKSLQIKGIYAQNRQKHLPKLVHNIGVISPENAAGLADFKHYLNPLIEHQLCRCDYYSAVFQGEHANKSINDCLQKIADNQADRNYQLIVIIRGGGSLADLQFLEEYAINEAVCLSALPIWVGLGHQTDKLLINEVAHRHFPTPTAVARQLVQHILTPLQNAISQWSEIDVLSKQRLAGEKARIEKQHFLLHKYCYRVSKKSEQQLSIQQTALGIHTDERIRKIKNNMDKGYQSIPLKIRAILQEKKHNLQQQTKELKKMSTVRLQEYKNSLQVIHSIIQNSHPKKILKRGFAIIRDEENQPLKKVKQISQKHRVSIEMDDGSVEVEIQKKN